MKLSRNELTQRITDYFAALDQGHVDAAVACFAPEATLTCESDGTHLRGHAEIRAFFEEICGDSCGMEHETISLVTDLEHLKAAVELTYKDKLKDGRSYDMRNCNFFDFATDGTFLRVHFWLGSPLD